MRGGCGASGGGVGHNAILVSTYLRDRRPTAPAPRTGRSAAAADRIPRSALALVAAAAVVATVLHAWAGLTYPYPWVDESHFLAPARSLLRHGTLAAPQINAPRGIFWVPEGYSVLMAPVAWSIELARATSLVAMLVWVWCLVRAAGSGAPRRAVPVAGAALAWLCTGSAVMAANIARMEAPILALAGVALVLASRGRWLGAVAVAAFAPLIHPVGVAVFVATGLAGLWFRGAQRPRPLDRVLAVAAVVAWLAQAMRYAANWDIAASHLEFQLLRKAGRSLAPSDVEVALLVVIAGVGLLTVTALRRRAGAGVAALSLLYAGGFMVVVVLGNEMWYEVLRLPTALLLLVVAAAALGLGDRVPARLTGVVTLAIALATVGPTLQEPRYEMRIEPGGSDEWAAFTEQAVAALERVDAQVDQPTTVAIHRLSGIGPWLYDRDWRNLRVVQPTPVTPLAAPDLELFTLDGREVSGRYSRAEMPDTRRLLTIDSPEGRFRLVLFEGPGVR